MTAILSLIPARYHDKAKGIISAVAAVLVALSVALPSVPDWLTIALGFLGALGVYRTPAPGYEAPYDGVAEEDEHYPYDDAEEEAGA